MNTGAYYTSAHIVSSLLSAELFNFSIPINATVTGLLVQVIGHSQESVSDYTPPPPPNTATCVVKDNYIQLITYNHLNGTNHASNSLWPNGYDSAITYGGSSDTWGLQLTQNMMMRPDFGVALGVDISVLGTYRGCTAYVDAIQMTVTYYLPVITTSSTTYLNTYTNIVSSSTVTTTSTSVSTSSWVTTPNTVTLTYSPTMYTFTAPYTTQPSAVTTTTVALTTTSQTQPSLLGWLSISQTYAFLASLVPFLTGFGMVLFGGRKFP